MKRFFYRPFLSTVILVLVLIGCNYESEPIQLEPVVIDLLEILEIEVITTFEFHSSVFTEQGHLVEDEYWTDSDLEELIAELEIELPPLEEPETSFDITLARYEFADGYEGDRIPVLAVPDRPNSSKINHAGTYIFEIKQLVPIEFTDRMQVDNEVKMVQVIVTENEAFEILVATVEKENVLVFEKSLTYDVSELLQNALTQRWEKRVADAYAQGYEYVLNEENEYIRVVSRSARSGFAENYATMISNQDALSYTVLVNRNWQLRSDFSPGDMRQVNVSSFHGNHLLRESAATAAEDLFAAASENGHILVVTSGYRSYWTQASTHNHWINVMGETEARRVSARPGHSEHQLGLALDITTHALGGLSENFSTTPEGTWIRENAHHFGFIVRYPQGREDDTGYIYEPWHIRFVGVEAATEIFNDGLILEEYLGRW